MLGGIVVAYPLAHGHYAAGTALALLGIFGITVYRRLTRHTLRYSSRAAIVGAIAGLLVAGNLLVRTEVARRDGCALQARRHGCFSDFTSRHPSRRSSGASCPSRHGRERQVQGGVVRSAMLDDAVSDSWLIRLSRDREPGIRTCSRMYSQATRGTPKRVRGFSGPFRWLLYISVPWVFVLSYLNWVVVLLEQSRFADVFGEDYARYGERVRRWL